MRRSRVREQLYWRLATDTTKAFAGLWRERIKNYENTGIWPSQFASENFTWYSVPTSHLVPVPVSDLPHSPLMAAPTHVHCK